MLLFELKKSKNMTRNARNGDSYYGLVVDTYNLFHTV